jgi:hypothetical protein
MTVDLGSFSNTPIGAIITLILQILFFILFITPAVAMSGFILYIGLASP